MQSDLMMNENSKTSMLVVQGVSSMGNVSSLTASRTLTPNLMIFKVRVARRLVAKNSYM
jgi:hypothetical protein